MILLLAAAAISPSCRRQLGTYDISALDVTRYRYLIDPKDPLVHVVAEVHNSGSEMVEAAVVVVSGIGRDGEIRGESRKRIENIAPGETRALAISLRNRARLATVEVNIEAVPQEERNR
jgi:hypothetical protein